MKEISTLECPITHVVIVTTLPPTQSFIGQGFGLSYLL